MPEVQDAMRRAAQKTRAKSSVRLALDQGLEHQRILGRIVFQVGVLNNDVVAGGFLDATAQRRSFAHVIRLQNDADLRMLGLQFREDFARAIPRAVVDADQLDLQRNGEDLLHHLAKRGALVINRHDDGEFHGLSCEGYTLWKFIMIVNRVLLAGYYKLGYIELDRKSTRL